MAIPRQILIKWANKQFDLFALLRQIGMDDPYPGMKCFCPFHPDEEGGKMSAKIFQDALHCFSEAKQYRPYNILRFMGYSDEKIEVALRNSGDPPNDLYLYDNERIDLCSGLMPLKTKFLKKEIEFLDYAKEVSKEMIRILMKKQEEKIIGQGSETQV